MKFFLKGNQPEICAQNSEKFQRFSYGLITSLFKSLYLYEHSFFMLRPIFFRLIFLKQKYGMNVQLHIIHTINNTHPWIHDRISLMNCSIHLYIRAKVCQCKILFNFYYLMFIGNFNNNFQFKYMYFIVKKQ